jgi:hypothetical protein
MGLFYVRYMDDWVILARTRWKLRGAVKAVQELMGELKLVLHPDNHACHPHLSIQPNPEATMSPHSSPQFSQTTNVFLLPQLLNFSTRETSTSVSERDN